MDYSEAFALLFLAGFAITGLFWGWSLKQMDRKR